MFCKRFGATWKDSWRLIQFTLNYSLSIRSKSKRFELQSDNQVHYLDVTYHGKNFPIYFRRQDLSMLYEVWMDQSYDLKNTKVTSGDILDIGAHVGFTTLYYWTQLGDKRHYLCIEGSEKNIKILKQNIKTIPQNTLLQYIITSDGRPIRFYDEMSGHLHQVHDTLGDLHDSVTLNNILPTSKHPKIALCKMDIEGMEYEILTKNNKWLNTVEQLYLELHDSKEYVLINQSLEHLGFSTTTEKDISHFIKL